MLDDIAEISYNQQIMDYVKSKGCWCDEVYLLDGNFGTMVRRDYPKSERMYVVFSGPTLEELLRTIKNTI